MYRGWIILPDNPIGNTIVIECNLFLKGKHTDDSFNV